jgi:hypothetical protein
MISIEKVREVLDDNSLTDEQLTEIRDALYAIVNQVFDGRMQL